jgi:thiol-disulfide isomerase/thioredoxin
MAAASVFALGMVASSLTAREPTTVPAASRPLRSAKEIYQDITAVQKGFARDGRCPGFADLSTAAGRAQYGTRVSDLLLERGELYDELSRSEFGEMSMTQPGGPVVAMQSHRITDMAMSAALGNGQAAGQLSALAGDADRELALSGHIGQLMVDWLLANHDPAAQGKVLDGIEDLAKASPASESLARNLLMIRQGPDLSPAFANRIDGLYVRTLSGAVSDGVRAGLDAGATARNALGKPVVLAGRTSDGKDFSTKSYAGKVVLVDFWATWCGPCRAVLPRVRTLYDRYHDQGLEVVGVSCDGDGQALAKFTAKNRMPWVELWDKRSQEGMPDAMHALYKQWRLDGIPQMFLIDRAGRLRSVDAGNTFEQMVPALLAEKSGPL